MAIRQREYLFSVNEFKEPSSVQSKQAISILLVRLIMMEPGTDPLHPTMGIGIKKYRYGVDNTYDLRMAIENQIKTFLPMYQNVTVSIVITEEKLCNIEISIDDIVYVYDSKIAPIPISLSDVSNN